MKVLRLSMLALSIMACHSSQTDADDAPAPASTYRRDTLTREEILNSAEQGADLYAAIQSLRPKFLSAPLGVRPSTAVQSLAVYINGIRQPGIETLRAMPAAAVEEVQYLEPMKAQAELGPIAGAGAVVITLHRTSTDPVN